jgi:DNA-binding CsgD family transcriptional regulator
LKEERIEMAGLRDQNRALLTPREKEALKLLKQGKSAAEVAMVLGIRERTVKFHVSNILQKLNAANRTHALAIAIEKGLLK